MKLKKKLRNFFTLTRKANGGFTLVELIVVIAILGVLAGVGTVGYSGYVKSAGKKSDLTTVGNIMRAAEYGSYLFTMDDPLQMSNEGLQLPLGFVVLTNEGMSGMESGSELLETFVPDAAPCQILPIGKYPNNDGVYPVLNVPGGDYSNIPSANKRSVTASVHGGDHSINLVVWDEAPMSYSGTYCYTCSLRMGAICEKTTRIRTNTTITNDPNLMAAAKSKTLTEQQKSFIRNNEATYAIMDMTKLVTSGCVDGEVRSIETYDKDNVSVKTDGTIAQMMQLAFGDDYQNIKLQGNWTADGLNSSLSTLYANADAMFADLEGMVQGALNDPEFGSMLGSNIDEAMEAFIPPAADRYANTFTKEQYVDAWGKLANDSGPTGNKGADLGRWGGYFGYTLSDLTNTLALENKAGYMVGVGAYNAGFASYVRSTTPPSGTHTAETCASSIVNYGDALEYGSADAFNDAVPVSAVTFAEGGKLACPACASLHAQYLKDEAWRPNAEAFYDLVVTLDDNHTKALTESNLMGISYMDWYENYIAEFQNLYGTLDGVVDNAGNAIVIMFHKNSDESIGFNVFPPEANPRKD